jgi:putative mRNA 3-end processing factor
MDYSELIDLKNIDVIFISHSHFDHTSALLPLYLAGCKAPIVASTTTIDFLVATLGKDKSRLLLDHLFPVTYGERIDITEGLQITLINAGHIPGSAMALITTSKERILYTGDFCLRDHFPVKGCANEVNMLGKVDIAIMDCSFADSRFKGDAYFYKTLGEECDSTLAANKNVLIAADPEVMSQNIFLSLQKFFGTNKITKVRKPPIYVEYRAIEYMQIVRTRLQDLPRDFQFKLQSGIDPFASVMRKTISSNQDRREALSKPSIIISGPNNRLSSFPLFYFLPQIANYDGNLLVFTGFGGKVISEHLRNKKEVKLRDATITLKAKIFNHQHPDAILAFHCDYPQLEFTIDKMKPEILIPFHAGPNSLAKAYLLSKKFGAESFFPSRFKEMHLR